MTPPPPDDRPRRLGRHGEEAARAWLERRGHRILATNLRTRDAEIDLLVRRHRILIAVEVKTRRDGAPERAVSAAQRGRLERALRSLAMVTRPRPRLLRVDIVAVVVPDDARAAQILHLPGPALPP